MAAPTAPVPVTETVGDVTYIRTDPELPPVAILDRLCFASVLASHLLSSSLLSQFSSHR